MTARYSCWSITINNPTEEDVRCEVPGWVLKGQYEEGASGTRHFQGMLCTPQVRASAVKRVFPRAHIEGARNKKALEKYINKEETRLETFTSTGVPTIFEYQRMVGYEWNWDHFDNVLVPMYDKKPEDDVAMIYLDNICAKMIREGAIGLEFISINPMWRSSWKRFYRSIIARNATKQVPQEEVQSPSPPQGGSPVEGEP